MVDLTGIGRVLLALEINTIVSDGISAEPLPGDGQALIRIAQLYKGFLGEVLIELATEDAAAAMDLPTIRLGDGTVSSFADWDVASGGMRTFAALQAAAHACRRARALVPHPNGMRAEHDAILARVAAACSDVQAMLRRLKLGDAAITTAAVDLAEDDGIDWPKFDHDMLLELRRIWETGVDVIVMQTVVRLDGGVTTRVLDGWDGNDAQPLRDSHQRSVAIALDRWTLLVDIARDVAGFFLGQRAQADSVSSGSPPPLADRVAGDSEPASRSRVAGANAAG
jgi:hypothetical protein